MSNGADEFAEPVHDLDAERFLLAAMMRSGAEVEQAAEIVTAENFYRPAHGVLFHAMVSMYAAGEPIDPVTLRAQLEAHGEMRVLGGGGAMYLLELMGLPVSGRASHYARIVLRHATRRVLASVGNRLVAEAMHGDVDEAALIGRGHALLDQALTGSSSFDFTGLTADEICDSEEITSVPLIPGLLNAQERAVVVGPEGSGKSILGLQMAYAAAAGVHPFQHQVTFDPCRVLILDLENPQDIVQRRCRTFRTVASANPGWDAKRLTVCHKPGGLNLTSPRDAYGLAKLIRSCAPQLIVAGPIYKMMWGVKADLEVHAQVAAFWDRMREEHGVTLWLEAHAPYGGEGKREMRPEGTNLWAKWCEFGISLNWAVKAHGGLHGALDWSYFKGQREEGRPWPSWLTRHPVPGTSWPWVANWDRRQPS